MKRRRNQTIVGAEKGSRGIGTGEEIAIRALAELIAGANEKRKESQ